MKFEDMIKMSFKDLFRRKGRIFLTAFAVAIGVMLIATLVGIGLSGKSYLLGELKKNSNVKRVRIMPLKYIKEDNSESDSSGQNYFDDNFKLIDNSVVEKLMKLQNVNDVEAMISVPVSEVKIGGKDSSVTATVTGYRMNNRIFSDEDIDTVRSANNNNSINPVDYGRNLNASDKNGVLVGERYLKKIGIKDYKAVIGKEIILIETASEDNNVKLKPMEVKGTVVGVINDKFTESDGIIVTDKIAADIKGYYSYNSDYLKTNGYDDIYIYAKNAGDVAEIDNEVKGMGYMPISYEVIADQAQSVFTKVEMSLTALGIVVLFVAALGIVNTMTMSICERTKAIGIMKSVGASSTNINNIFITESGAIGFIGGIMGILFSEINMQIVSIAANMYLSKNGLNSRIEFGLPFWLIGGSLIFSIVISVAAGLYPSAKAAKLDPIEALSY